MPPRNPKGNLAALLLAYVLALLLLAAPGLPLLILAYIAIV